MLVCRFADALNSGLLEVIVPSPLYYPNFDTLQDTFGDTLERVRQDVLKFWCLKYVCCLFHQLHVNRIAISHNYLTRNYTVSQKRGVKFLL